MAEAAVARARRLSPAASWFYLFACNLMWSLQFTCVKLVQDQVGPFATVWAPIALSTLLLAPVVLREPKPLAGRRGGRDVWLFLALAVVGVFPAQFFTTWGTRMSLASNAALIMLALPVSTAVMARVFLGEKMSRVRWISFIIAVAGVLLCSARDLRGLDFGAGYLAGNALVFLGMNGSAFYNSYGKKVLDRYSPLAMLFWTYVAMLAILTPLLLAFEADVFGRAASFSGQTWTGLALLAFFHNFLSMVLFLKALDSLDATQAALSNYLITFFALPISAIWLGERLSAAGIAGGIAVLAGTLLITLWERGKS